MNRELGLLLVICLIGGLWHLHTRPPSPIERAPGVLAPAPPRQSALDSSPQPIIIDEYTLTPLAKFEVEARLLSRLGYSDEGADISPLDFALGWGRMSDTAIIEQLNVSQGSRFFTYRWDDQPPIPLNEIVVSAANVHLIPANVAVEAALKRLRVGQVIELKGLLVEANRPDGWRWRSSLTRTDNGNGACELMLVHEARAVR